MIYFLPTNIKLFVDFSFQILPLLMSPTLEDQERHLLVKVIDRVLYKLDDLVRPYVHKILVVIEPLLIDEVRRRKCVRLYTTCHALKQL